MLRYLIDAVGFNNAVRYVATLTSVTCIFSFIFATPNPVHEFHKPENWFEVRTWFDTDAFRNKAWCWFTASVSFMFFGFYPIFFNLEEWAAVRGFGTRNSSGANQTVPQSVDDQPLQTFWLLTIMNGASTVGRLALALFSDKIGPLNMHIASQLICSLLTLVLWSLASSETDAIAFCVVFGIFSGMVIGLPPASVANILSCTYTTPETIALAKKKLGHWVGMMYSCAAVPALLGPVISGHLITKYDTYITVQMWSGTNLFLSFVCMMMARWNLACADGQSFEHHLSRKSASTKEKLRLGSDATAAGLVSPTALSQAPTQVPSVTNSRERLEQPNQPSERMV
jgi:MFS family permease